MIERLQRFLRRGRRSFHRASPGEVNRAAEVLLTTLAERVSNGTNGLGAWDLEESAKTGFSLDPSAFYAIALERTESTGCNVFRLDEEPGVVFFEYGSAQVLVRIEHDGEREFQTGSPVVRLFSILVENVQDLERASQIVGDLNASFPILGIVELDSDRDICIVATVPSRWLTPNYLVELAITLVIWVDETDTKIADEVGGETSDLDDPDNTHGRRMISNL